MVADGLCELCYDCNEDSVHALWYCDLVKPIWMSDNRFSFLRAQKFSKFEDVFQFLCMNVPPKLVALFTMVAWSIWERRNKGRKGQKTWAIEEAFNRDSNLLQEF